MSNYYGVVHSDEHLAHYGIRGMKWGVRKALKNKDQAKLRKHYLKASKRLEKLSYNANRDAQNRRFKETKSNMGKLALDAAIFGGAVDAGVSALTKAGLKGIVKNAGYGAIGSAALTAAINSRGILARRHTTDAGHARAVKKRDKFRKEMQSTFAGTKYDPRRRR